MNNIHIHFPKQLVFGDDCFKDFISSTCESTFEKVFIIADPNVNAPLLELSGALDKAGIGSIIYTEIKKEPGIAKFDEIRRLAEKKHIDAVIGIGGGSVLDLAKLLAAMYKSGQETESVFGNGQIRGRKLFLACIPTTAGTGSEMSPNSILLDENTKQKKGIISPFLVPDSTYVDPVLTHSVPPSVTAATGIDALTHCLEAFANRYANPVTDLYALEGIRLIYRSLEIACIDGSNAEARADVALASMYGGMCLGPVNTAAVHALAYPLGGEYSIPHGISNALLLPHVLRVNLTAGVERYAMIAGATGVGHLSDQTEMAERGIENIAELCKRIGIPDKIYSFNVPREAVPALAKSAMTVQRLLKNNLHSLTEPEIRDIYYKLF